MGTAVSLTQNPDTVSPQLRGFGIRFESNKLYRIFRFNDTNLNFTYDGRGEEKPLSGEASVRQRNMPGSLELKINSGGTLISPNNNILIFDRLGNPRTESWTFSQKTFVLINPKYTDIQEKCVTMSFNRIREGIWNGISCELQ